MATLVRRRRKLIDPWTSAMFSTWLLGAGPPSSTWRTASAASTRASWPTYSLSTWQVLKTIVSSDGLALKLYQWIDRMLLVLPEQIFIFKTLAYSCQTLKKTDCNGISLRSAQSLTKCSVLTLWDTALQTIFKKYNLKELIFLTKLLLQYYKLVIYPLVPLLCQSIWWLYCFKLMWIKFFIKFFCVVSNFEGWCAFFMLHIVFSGNATNDVSPT